MIKISLRKNIIYLLLLFISYYFRRVLQIVLDKVYSLSASVIFCFLMCLGQIVGGASIYIHQENFLRKKNQKKKYKSKPSKRYSIITTELEMNKEDGSFKIMLLIFFASFFDLEEYFITTIFLKKFEKLSDTAILRLNCIMTITSSLICKYVLRFKIYRHQIFSLIILSFFAFIIILLEFIYKPDYIIFWKYFVSFLLIAFHFFFLSFTDVIEKYLADYDYISPFQIIMIEGIISFIMLLIYSTFINPFTEVSNIYNQVDTGIFILLVFFLLLYLVLSAFVNIYKILCNVLFSPVTKSLGSYFFISPFIIFHYVDGNDFIVDEKSNLFYFLINLFIAIAIDFFGLIYNEIIIFKCCGLSNETHEGISFRAIQNELQLIDNTNYNDITIDYEN